MKKIIAALLISILLEGCGSGGVISQSEPDAFSESSKSASESLQSKDLQEEISESDAYTDDFKHRVHTVLKYHKDLENGKITDAEAKGMWAAFKLNIGMYKTNYGIASLEHRAYYYAMYGESEYLDEFGYNEDFIIDVKEYITELS